ncbi:MAG: hypothetical protein QM490_00445 [Candidatus Gracilibacteria bacterium]
MTKIDSKDFEKKGFTTDEIQDVIIGNEQINKGVFLTEDECYSNLEKKIYLKKEKSYV